MSQALRCNSHVVTGYNSYSKGSFITTLVIMLAGKCQ